MSLLLDKKNSIIPPARSSRNRFSRNNSLRLADEWLRNTVGFEISFVCLRAIVQSLEEIFTLYPTIKKPQTIFLPPNPKP